MNNLTCCQSTSHFITFIIFGLLIIGNTEAQSIIESDHIIIGSNGTNNHLISETDTVFYFGKIRGAFRFGAYNLRSGKGLFDAGPFAFGLFSGAWGYGNIAEGDYSTSFGKLNQSTSEFAVSWGLNNKSHGVGTTTWGVQNDSEGLYSTTGGFYNISNGFATTTFGMFADPIVEVDAFHSVNQSNPLFIIGNGSSANDRSNAMVVLRNGNVGIGTNDPITDLHIVGDLSTSIRIDHFSIWDRWTLGAAEFNSHIIPDESTRNLGSNIAGRHWNRVIANDFIVYQNSLKSNSPTSNTPGLNALLKITPITYRSLNKNGNEELQSGFDFESLLNSIPHVVLTHEEFYNPDTDKMETREMETPAISYMKLIPVLTKAIQDLTAIVDQQNERISQLENQE